MQHLASGQVGDIGTVLFTEAHQYATLLDDILYTQTPLGTVSPHRPRERWQHGLRHHLADVFEIIEQCLLLGPYLCSGFHVLQTAAATESEMRAPGLHTVGGGLFHRGYPALVKAPAGCPVFKTDNLTRQRTIDKDRLAIQVRDTAPVVGQRLYGDTADGFRQAFPALTFTHDASVPVFI